MNRFKLSTLIALGALLIAAPAFAQFDLGGRWIIRSGQDAMDSGPGPDPVDYLGIPLSA